MAIQFFDITPGSEAWHLFRYNGIGASEAATILNRNRWQSPIRLYHHKVGTVPDTFEGNEATFWGTYMEKHILDMWQYWDGKDYKTNYNDGRIIRHKEDVSGIFVNDKMPWLFITPDALIPERYVPAGMKAPLECKTIDKLAFNEYGGLPPQYYVQIHQQMLVLEATYGEFVYLVGGNQLIVESVELDNDLAVEILEKTYKFWYKHVLPAREAYEEKRMDIIQQLEPEVDSSIDYENFQQERFKTLSAEKKITGSKDLKKIAIVQDILQQYIKLIEKERRLLLNVLKKYHVDNEAIEINMGNIKSIWRKRHIVRGVEQIEQEDLIKEILKLKLYSDEITNELSPDTPYTPGLQNRRRKSKGYL